MPQRKYSKEQKKVARANPRVILPVTGQEYKKLSAESGQFREWLDGMIAEYPELFPEGIMQGYRLHDILPESAKMAGVQFRRIKLKATNEEGKEQVLTIGSSDVMPYMTGQTDEVEKALFLRRFGVPYWGITHLFGRSDDYWYHMTTQFGRYEIVGTVVKEAGALPEHLLADEKHTRFNGEKGYIATTAGGDCILGASLTLAADEPALTQAYGYFQVEAQQVAPDYSPKTVNTDGWVATQKAWQTLFRTITVIQCFLHAFIKIRDCTKKRYQPLFDQIQQQVWDIYHAPNKTLFFRQLNAFQLWASGHLSGPAMDAVNKLAANADRFALAYDHPDAFRTSNMIDRHMIPLDRCLFASRYFHGDWVSAERQIRSWVLFHDFMPYCPRAKIRDSFISPVHKLNGFVYHENWLHNLLISTSSTGFRTNHRKCQN